MKQPVFQSPITAWALVGGGGALIAGTMVYMVIKLQSAGRG